MDQELPVGLASEIAVGFARRRRGASRRVVAAGNSRHSVVALDRRGFVIEAEAEGAPRLRGFVDILEGERRILRSLVQLAWARDGLAGYEFKQRNLEGPVAADYAPEGSAPESL